MFVISGQYQGVFMEALFSFEDTFFNETRFNEACFNGDYLHTLSRA